jgi:hypothetical protein
MIGLEFQSHATPPERCRPLGTEMLAIASFIIPYSSCSRTHPHHRLPDTQTALFD